MSLQPSYLNGKYYDHACLRISLPFGNNNFLTIHTKSVTYTNGMNKSAIMGVSPVPLGYNVGEYEGTLSITIIREAWEQLRSFFPTNGYGMVIFDAIFEYISLNDSFETSRLKFQRCELKSANGGSAQGQAGLDVQLEIVYCQLFEGQEEASLAPVDLDKIVTTV